MEKLAIGLGKGTSGDINLWGFEEPSIAEQQKIRDNDNLLVENFTKKIGKTELEGKILQHLTSILKNMSGYIKDVWLIDLGHKKLLRRLYNLAENNPDRSGYELEIKAVKGFMCTLHEWIDRCLENNRIICSLMADL